MFEFVVDISTAVVLYKSDLFSHVYCYIQTTVKECMM